MNAGVLYVYQRVQKKDGRDRLMIFIASVGSPPSEPVSRRLVESIGGESLECRALEEENAIGLICIDVY